MKRTTARSATMLAALPALAAIVLAGCTPNEPTTSPTAGTTPAIRSADELPAGLDEPAGDPHGGDHGAESTETGEADEHGSETSTSETPVTGDPAAAGAVAELKTADGSVAGTATFTTVAGGVAVSVSATGLAPGFHGLHIHAVNKCEPNSVAPAGGAPGNFLSAGGHLQLDGRTEHPASGDLVSILINADGTGKTDTTIGAFTVADLLAGTSIIIHEGADNFGNIPTSKYAPATPGGQVPDEQTLSTGDAGARIACGVIAAE